MTGGARVLTACAALLAATLSACASPGTPKSASGHPAATLSIRGIEIHNELPYAVMDVMVTVPATGAFAGCSNIMARTACSTSFRSVAYRGNPMVVSWKEQGEPRKTEEFVVKEPENAVPGEEAVLDVSIFAPGQAGARLVRPGTREE